MMRRSSLAIGKAILALCACLAAPALAQPTPIEVVAVPQFATPKNVSTSAGNTGTIARQVADLIAADLRGSGRIVAIGPNRARVYSFPEATAPNFGHWRTTGAKALVTGFVQERDDERLTVACYLHDVANGRELARQGFVVTPDEWRRAAHRCSDAVFTKLTGRSGGFDSSLAYVAESGAGANRVKRIATMDSDGTNHLYVTAGDSTVLTPRLSPAGDRIVYVGFTGGRPQVRIVDLSTKEDRLLVPGTEMSFAPRFSPDGTRLIFSMATGGNTDLYVTDLASGGVLRLTNTPGIDTSPSYSPDGTKITFESDRSGSPQLYVMRADGSAARRISFGGARYGAPAWSPDGETLAFTRIAGDGRRIGLIGPDGSGERVLTTGPFDDAPSWSASSFSLIFQRGTAGGGGSSLYVVPAEGGEPRALGTPQGGSDPDWSSGGAK